MQKNKRPTKLEEVKFNTHLNIDGGKDETINAALEQVGTVLKFIVGQDEIEEHDVSLVVELIIRERKETE